jgi:hypothetical protein
MGRARVRSWTEKDARESAGGWLEYYRADKRRNRGELRNYLQWIGKPQSDAETDGFAALIKSMIFSGLSDEERDAFETDILLGALAGDE